MDNEKFLLTLMIVVAAFEMIDAFAFPEMEHYSNYWYIFTCLVLLAMPSRRERKP